MSYKSSGGYGQFGSSRTATASFGHGMQHGMSGQVAMWSPSFIAKGSVSAFVGLVIGIMVSLIVNCTLLEISVNDWFASYFGLLFISVGLIILWRIKAQPKEQLFQAAASAGQTPEERKKQLRAFACLILFSGVLCFMLRRFSRYDAHGNVEQGWYVGITKTFGSWAKIPLYSVLGISVSFALTFSVIDLVNYVLGFVQGHNNAKPLVESPSQIYLVLCIALLMGAIFGIVFGTVDAPHAASYQMKLQFLHTEHLCYPIGAVLGAVGGFGNEYLRQVEVQYSPIAMEFDDDI